MPKQRRTPIWRDYLTKATLQEAVRAVVNPIPFDQEFVSDLLASLIAERHWHCKLHGTAPTKFKKTRGWGDGYDFWGWFEQGGWHKVSWKKCITPDTADDVLKRALRTAVRPFIAAYKITKPVCERCRLRPSEDVDHVEPSFDSIVRSALALMSEEQNDEVMKSLDWDEESEFLLPDDHPVARNVLKAHETVRLQAVCKTCHQENERERRG
jgi:hypothetical protein